MKHVLLSSLVLILVCASAGTAAALDFKMVERDDPCPDGYRLATFAEASENRQAACNVLEEWQIVRLADAGSMDGSGYECSTREEDDRELGGSLCVAAKSPRSEPAKIKKSEPAEPRRKGPPPLAQVHVAEGVDGGGWQAFLPESSMIALDAIWNVNPERMEHDHPIKTRLMIENDEHIRIAFCHEDEAEKACSIIHHAAFVPAEEGIALMFEDFLGPNNTYSLTLREDGSVMGRMWMKRFPESGDAADYLGNYHLEAMKVRPIPMRARTESAD